MVSRKVVEFASTLEDVIVKTVEGGQMTKDLSLLVGHDTLWLTTDEFMEALDRNLRERLS